MKNKIFWENSKKKWGGPGGGPGWEGQGGCERRIEVFVKKKQNLVGGSGGGVGLGVRVDVNEELKLL